MSQTFLEDVTTWSADQCRKNSSVVLPKLFSVLSNADKKHELVDTLKVICRSFVPAIEFSSLETDVFSQISLHVQVIYDSLLERIEVEINNATESSNTRGKLVILLEGCIEVVSCIENCICCVLQIEGYLELASILSLPHMAIYCIKTSYTHCKESGVLYGSLLGLVSSQLSQLFKKVHALQMNVLGLAEKIVLSSSSTDEEVDSMAKILHGFHDICQTAATLDVKIMVTMWKAISKLSIQHKAVLYGHLDVGHMLNCLCDDMITSHTYLLQLIPSHVSTGDDKAFMKNVKILGFQMKVLLAMIKEFDSCHGDCANSITRLLITLHSKLPPNLDVQHIEPKYIDELRKQVSNATESLLSLVIPCVQFCIFFTTVSNELDQNQHLAHCLLLLQIGDLLHNFSDNVQKVWMYPTLYQEDVPRQCLLNAIITAYSLCYTELSVPVHIAGIMTKGKPQRDVTLYEHIFTHICALTASQSADQFHHIEKSLLKYVLNTNVHTAILAIDVWCFLARYGTADLCESHCMLLSHIYNSLSPGNTTKQTHLSLLLNRLVKFLAPQHQEKFIQLNSVPEHLSLWSVVPLHVFGDNCIGTLAKTLLTTSLDVINSTIIASSATGQQLLKLYQALRALRNLYTTSNSLVPPHLSSQVKDKCCTLLQLFLSTEDSYTSISHPLIAATMEILVLLCHSLDNKAILQILKEFSGQILKQFSASVKVSVIYFLGALGTKRLPPTFEQPHILSALPRLFNDLLGDTNVVVHQHAVRVFARFAEETAHETVVPECLQSSHIIQQTVVSYLNEVANGKSGDVIDVEFTKKQCEEVKTIATRNISHSHGTDCESEKESTALEDLRQSINVLQSIHTDNGLNDSTKYELRTIQTQIAHMI